TDPTIDPPPGQNAGSKGNGINGTVVRRPNGADYRIKDRIRLPEDIPDGAANTLLLSEKRMNPLTLDTNVEDNDQGYAAGWDWDEIRWALNAPKQDRIGEQTPDRFGSMHVAGINAVFCDGSVRMIGYAIQSNNDPKNPGAWQRICIRNDGLPI